MSMLAGPKRKAQYVLVPRGKPLYNDDDRFGSKMLRKMGWTKGKGLGAKESGSVNFVRVNFKCDATGLGFEDRDDQWKQHERSFNGFLESLHAGNKNENNAESVARSTDEDELGTVGFGFQQTETKLKSKKLTEKISGQSLEERSKQSRARVHYKKYTKGKDLAQYSEKDLANIFGKKAAGAELADTCSSSDASESKFCFKAAETNESKLDTVPTAEDSVVLKTSSTSITDYFKNKMLQKKLAKRQNLNDERSTVEHEHNLKVDNEHSSIANTEKQAKKCKSKRGLMELDESLQQESCNVNDATEFDLAEVSLTEPKNKKKKQKHSKEAIDDIVSQNDATTLSHCQTEVQQKKKKQTNSIRTLNASTSKIEGTDVDFDLVHAVEKKTRSKGRKDATVTEATVTVGAEDQINLSYSKKKQNKRKSINEEDEKSIQEGEKSRKVETNLNCQTEGVSKTNEKPKKPQKSKSMVEGIEVDFDSVYAEEKTKKNKRCKDAGVTEATLTVGAEDEMNLSDSKKKKNKRKSTNEDDEKYVEEGEQSQKIETNLNCQKEDVSKTNEKPEKSEKSKNNVVENVKFVKLKAEGDASKITNIKEYHEFFRTYQISTFVAEKFRHLDLNKFKNSNLAQISGYSLSENLKLEIIPKPLDEFRILELWKRSFDKYSDRKLIREQIKQAANNVQSSTTKNVEDNKATKDGGNKQRKRGKKGLNNLKRHKRRNIFKLGV